MFGKKETVCFLGDSITTHGHFIKEVFEFLINNHKEDRVKLFNCGVPGDVSCRTAKRLYEDCLILNPQKVILMLGANDIKRAIYKLENSAEIKEKKAEQFELYKNSMREIIENCLAFGAEVIVCTPTPTIGTETEKQCNEALSEYIDFLKDVVKEKDLMLVDYNTTMTEMAGEGIMSEDGIHPTEKGHHVMAQILLKALGYIKECDFETMPVYSQKNLERYAAEQKYRDVRMVEWSSLNGFFTENPDASCDEIIEIAKKCRQDGIDAKMDWYVKSAENYINYFYRVQKLQRDVLKKTIEMYD